MGQYIASDPSTDLIKQANTLNSYPSFSSKYLKCVEGIKVPHYNIVYQSQDGNTIKYVYKFTSNQYIPIILTKKNSLENSKIEKSGHISGGEKLYCYRIKYKNKSLDKVKNVLFKKRIYGQKNKIIDMLAEMKLLSALQVGPYIGSMINDADGFYYQGYIEYYTEILFNMKSSSAKLMKNLQKYFLTLDTNKVLSFGYSVFHHQLVIRPELAWHQEQIIQSQSPTNIHMTSSLFNQNNSDQLKMSGIEDKISKQLHMIDEKTNMISSMENLLFQKNIDKCRHVFEESLKKVESKEEKMRHTLQFIELLQDSKYFNQYLQQVINKFLYEKQEHQLHKEQLLFLKKLQQKSNQLKLKSTEFSSEGEVQEFSQSCSLFGNDVKKSKLKFNIQESNNLRVGQIISEMSGTKTNQGKNEKELKENIEFEYAVMLMKSGKSRLALVCFERLLISEQANLLTQVRIYSMMGMIYYHRSCYRSACREFELGLSKLLKLRYYSNQMLQIYNSIGCTLYKQFKYERANAVFMSALAFKVGSNDMTMILKNNHALTLLKMNKLKQAKQQFIAILNSGEPINNAHALCKIYTNLGYMNMKAKQYTKAKDDFKFAIQVQEKCLLPYGYKPSPFLHNNMAMVRFKLREYRQSLEHFIKYGAQFEKLRSIEGVMVNFNIALAYKQCYKNQLATLHIEKCKKLLLTLPQHLKVQCQKRILAEADSISRNNIDQVSEQSSGAVIQGILSSLSRKT